MAQQFIEECEVWNYKRSLSMGCLGAIQNGLFMTAWYRILDRFVTPKTDPVSVIKKICCDEAVFAPQLAVSYLATSAYVARPGDWGYVRENVRTKALETWSNDMKLWPIANFFGFSFVPIAVRPAYASAIQLVWQTYLSSVGFRAHHPHAVGDAALAAAVATADLVDPARTHEAHQALLARQLASWQANFHALFGEHP
eukprot:TRINITY_DN2409_c0_g1_i1.p1 TRINITY_DN2409_c0_g1~~TRINITY_DN2409_c0_g1_i1.p1  ORF type:complete len:198 (-),score=55.60 TRINITY_DN2409_c0_g1_i1:669-1262(-)